MTFRIKRRDRRPYWRGTLTDAGAVVNLTAAASARLICKNSTITYTFPLTIINAALGQTGYDFTAADAATGIAATVAVYDSEVEVTWGDTTTQTFPIDGYDVFEVFDDLG